MIQQNYVSVSQVNLALKKPAYEWPVYNNLNPPLLVDGLSHASIVAHTSDSVLPYFAVDLGKTYKIAQVSITNRADCCRKLFSFILLFVLISSCFCLLFLSSFPFLYLQVYPQFCSFIFSLRVLNTRSR